MQLETYLQDKIFPELEKGRPDFDRPHTESVVFYLKEILKNTPNLSVDFIVLLISAYAHDWGYAGLFKNGKVLRLQDIMNMKELHAEKGVEKVTELLKDDFFVFLTDQQKERIMHLVGIHDRLKLLKDVDELVLMEADTLGGLDTDKIKPTVDNKSNEKFLRGVKELRMPLFITDYGKQKVKELIEKRKDYYKNKQHI
jgi:hypothetical protein